MRHSASAALLTVLALLAAGCSRPGEGRPPASFPPPPATTQAPVMPRVVGTAEQRDVPTATDGVFRLVEAGGARLPAAATADACAPRLVAGTLGLAGNRYSVSLTTQATCEGGTSPQVQRGEGRLEIDASTVRMVADTAAGYVRSAMGVFHGSRELRLLEVTTASGTRPVQWRFVREGELRR